MPLRGWGCNSNMGLTLWSAISNLDVVLSGVVLLLVICGRFTAGCKHNIYLWFSEPELLPDYVDGRHFYVIFSTKQGV